MPAAARTPRVRARRALWVGFALLAACYAGACGVVASTPFGGWVQSFAAGTGVRWQEAYQGTGLGRGRLPSDPGERERLLLASASAEDEPPRSPALGPRLRGPGTLARLRYEALDASGATLEAWELRALVPALPRFEPDGRGRTLTLGRAGCPNACREELARHR